MGANNFSIPELINFTFFERTLQTKPGGICYKNNVMEQKTKKAFRC